MKKAGSEKGMTLSETLAAVLIMSLVTLAIAAGVTAGSRVYSGVQMKAEGQTILSTNVAALSDYLENGYGISPGENGTISIQFSETSDSKIRIYNNGEHGIYVQYQDNDGNDLNGTEPQPLISEKDNTSGLYAELSDVKQNNDKTVTSYTITVVDKNGKKYNGPETVSVRSLIHYPTE